ncbi:TIGR01459 family HAD-type hydrolase [Kordiimonas marina]|uniref:TIGR01459 family HAD-type hydrolase n=1 Tax=Kordiimonas marina TaxID=2872312 RepID=UPI001FF24E30|nr:TIGR01459 family HAD-type hydrolase [Kordiimonas marina]MCJ9428459.1 TIGR01459 family HAD-type hydrolase [Kordiimonas marina]
MPNTSGAAVALIPGLRHMAEDLSLIICDLWGVMHDGMALNPDAVTAIEAARKEGIETVFLSNAPRPRTHVREHLLEMGLPKALTDRVVTSGGLARDEVRNRYAGARLYHVGPESDRNTIEGLPVEEVSHPDDADIILATDLDYPSVEAHRDWLKGAAEKGVPLLCANPDRVVHVGPRLYTCAGAIADLYGDMGGEVHWFGKPMASALTSCLTEVGMAADTDGRKVLMIGDSLQTDMAGARAAGFGGLFIAGGIHRAEWPQLVAAAEGAPGVTPEEFSKIFGAGKAVPHAVMERLHW